VDRDRSVDDFFAYAILIHLCYLCAFARFIIFFFVRYLVRSPFYYRGLYPEAVWAKSAAADGDTHLNMVLILILPYCTNQRRELVEPTLHFLSKRGTRPMRSAGTGDGGCLLEAGGQRSGYSVLTHDKVGNLVNACCGPDAAVCGIEGDAVL
jgi:hypothetical protein